jgi:hypothetical protein
MSDTTFVDGTTLTAADWFNDVNDLAYTSIGITAGAPPASKAALVYLLGNGLTEDTAPDLGADYVLTVDTSGSTAKKVIAGRVTAGTLGTPTATTSGNSKSFTGIPAWVTCIELSLAGVSGASTDQFVIQIGDSGGLETSDYVSSAVSLGDSAAGAAATSTAGFTLSSATAAAATYSGTARLVLESAAANTWVCTGIIARVDGTAVVYTSAGSKSLSGTLTQLALVTSGGNAFDAGQINIRYS